MKASEYKAAREALGWTHARLARVIGVSERTPYRYAEGEAIPEPVARLLVTLVWARLTTSTRRFNELVNELERRHG
jgi:DNA-binding transcriptional regulator YiaG